MADEDPALEPQALNPKERELVQMLGLDPAEEAKDALPTATPAQRFSLTNILRRVLKEPADTPEPLDEHMSRAEKMIRQQVKLAEGGSPQCSKIIWERMEGTVMTQFEREAAAVAAAMAEATGPEAPALPPQLGQRLAQVYAKKPKKQGDAVDVTATTQD